MSARRVIALTLALGAIATGAITGSVTAGPTGGALPPELVQVLDIAGEHGVPDDAAMVAVNITATRAAEKGYLTAYPCDGDLPTASNVNYLADQNVPNLALVRIADDSTICIATSAVSDLVVDVIGYVPTGSTIRALPQPHRALDTRRTRTPGAGDTVHIPVTNVNGVAPDADLVMANITAIARGDTGYLTTHPCLSSTPDTSSVNYGPGQTNANFVTSRIDTTGAICITTSQPADIVVDIAATATAGITTLPAPVRIIDTRLTAPRPAGSTLTLDIADRHDVPATTNAAVYNLTATNAAAVGFATSHPCLPTPPDTSNLNYAPGPPRANGTITKLSPAGHLCITTSHQVNLVVDLIGYTTDTAHYVPLTPARILDTRKGWERQCDWVIVSGWETITGPHYLEAVRFDNGDSVKVEAGEPKPGGAAEPTIAADCSGFYVLKQPDDSTPFAPQHLHFVPFDGSPPSVSSGEIFARVRQIGSLADGTVLGVDTNGRVWDLETGAPGVELAIDQAVYAAAFSSNGIIAIRDGGHFQSTDDSDGVVSLWDVRTGVRVGGFAVARRVVDIDLSPDGTYLSLEYQSDGLVPSVSAITTLSGQVVDAVSVADMNAPIYSHFVGRGSLLVCGGGWRTWDLFSDPRHLPLAKQPYIGSGDNWPRCQGVWT